MRSEALVQTPVPSAQLTSCIITVYLSLFFHPHNPQVQCWHCFEPLPMVSNPTLLLRTHRLWLKCQVQWLWWAAEYIHLHELNSYSWSLEPIGGNHVLLSENLKLLINIILLKKHALFFLGGEEGHFNTFPWCMFIECGKRMCSKTQ